MEIVESRPKRHACYDISSSNPTKQQYRRSSAWEIFTTLPGGKKAKCNYCGREIVCGRESGTSALKKHKDRCKSYKIYQESENNKALTLDGTMSDDKEKLVVNGFCPIRCRQATVKMIILDELPFSFFENHGFRYFCSQTVPLYKVPSEISIMKDVLDLFKNEKASLKSILSGQRVSFSTDIWTAITRVSYMVITAHFIDENWKLHRRIISFSSISDHKEKTIAKQFERCLADWDIKKVFTITVNNTNANDHVLNLLKTKWKKTLGADGLILDGEFMHVRCAAHILNLIVGEGLKNVSASVNSIRNAVKYVQNSNSRLQAFQVKADEEKISRGSLVLDCSTRWNTTFLMLKSALKLETAFDQMAEEDKIYNSYFHEDDTLTGKKRIGPPSRKDWDDVRSMVEFLKVFYESALAFSASKKVTSNMCFNQICKIERVLRTFPEIPDSDIAFKNIAQTMKFEKFDEYWKGFEKINKLMFVASVLDPRLKMRFLIHCFEKIYGEGSQGYKKCAEMKEMLMSLLRKLYNVYSSSYRSSIDLANHISNQDEEITIIDASSQRLDEQVDQSDVGVQVGVEDEFFGEWSQLSHDDIEEIDIYLKEKIVNPKVNFGCNYDLLDWWKSNSKKFPVLVRLAKDIFAIPVSTVSSEYAFSTGGRMLDEYRSYLPSSILEALVLTHNWLQSSSQVDEE